MRVFVITNDNYLWCLPAFAYLFNKYWSSNQEVVVVGYNIPKFTLPSNFKFYSLGIVNAPQGKWSNGLIKFLYDIPDEFGVIMLEDYWISRPVDIGCINIMVDYMRENTHILRFDLTGDVAHVHGDCRDAIPYGFIGHYDLVQKPSGAAYRMSFQPAIWNVRLLLSLLKSNKNPWEVEIETAIPDDVLVLGTKQWPLRISNAIYKGELDTKAIKRLHPDDYKVVEPTFPDITRRAND